MRSITLILLLGACTVGEAPKSGDSGVSTAERDTCKQRVAAPPAPYSHVSQPTGPRAGQGCLDAACHGPGGAGGQFAFAGTVYKETSAQNPAAGVNVRIFKPNEKTTLGEAVTDTAGNFVIRMPGNFPTFPYEVHVTACGPTPPNDIRPMVSPLSSVGEANCNLGGSCHGVPAGNAAIYFPDA